MQQFLARPALFICFSALSPALAPGSGHAQNAVDSSLTAVEREVLAVEDEYVPAEVNRNESELRRLLDDRFRYNRADGKVVTKDEYIESIMKLSMVDQKLSERSVLVEGNVAITFGTTELTFARSDSTLSVSSLRYTATYINRDGHWRMLAVQLQKKTPTQ